MRKFSKIVLGAAAVLGVAGLGLTAGGVGMGATMDDMRYEGSSVQKVVNRMVRVAESLNDHDDWDDDDWDDHDDWDDDDWEIEDIAPAGKDGTYELENISSMDIELNYDELILQEYDGKNVKVSISGDYTDKVRVTTEGTELKIESKGKTKPEERQVVVRYPAGMEFTEVNIDVEAGTATLENDLNTREFSASVGAGTLENYGAISAREADIEVGVGTLALTDLDTEYIDAECGIGTMELEAAGKKTDYNYRLSCGAGTLSLEDEEFAGLGGRKIVDNDGAVRKMQLECGMGTLEVSFTE